MRKYIHADHARRTCVTAYPKLVTKSQRYAKSRDLLEKTNLKTKGCCIKNIMTCLWMFLKAFDGKTEEKLKDSLKLI